MYNSSIYQDVFYVDGSLRDIYVLRTSELDWQILLNFLCISSYSIEFLINGQYQSLPKQVEDIFLLEKEVGITLCIDRKCLALNCHFFTREEIEFDLDPVHFQDDQQVLLLLTFIRTIGHLLHKTVILTPENNPEFPLFQFNPGTNEDIWFLEETES